MSAKSDLADEITQQLDGIRVQWQDIARQTDPALAAQKREGVFANMKDVGEMMRKHAEMADDA